MGVFLFQHMAEKKTPQLVLGGQLIIPLKS